MVRVSDLEPELGLWGRKLTLCSLLLPLHLSFQEGMTPAVGRMSRNPATKISLRRLPNCLYLHLYGGILDS